MANTLRTIRLRNEFTLSQKQLTNLGLLGYDNYTVTLCNTKDKLKVAVVYRKMYDRFDFPNLPVELNELIHSFNFHYISIDLMFIFSENYPFEMPNISISNFEGCDDEKLLCVLGLDTLKCELDEDWASNIYIYHIIIHYLSLIYLYI
jgi:hypothetical protein